MKKVKRLIESYWEFETYDKLKAAILQLMKDKVQLNHVQLWFWGMQGKEGNYELEREWMRLGQKPKAIRLAEPGFNSEDMEMYHQLRKCLGRRPAKLYSILMGLCDEKLWRDPENGKSPKESRDVRFEGEATLESIHNHLEEDCGWTKAFVASRLRPFMERWEAAGSSEELDDLSICGGEDLEEPPHPIEIWSPSDL
jgi:hypothetical protein